MHVPVVVIGAGQAGLAMSHELSTASIEHVVLDRGAVAQTWRTERWDSLRLLTPNWMTRLPGHRYQGDDPDGYMTAAEVTEFLVDYAIRSAAPVCANVAVERVRPDGRGFGVETDQGRWTANAVVVATGACSHPHIPTLTAALPDALRQLTAREYRHPGQVGPGEVLVVGASASGLQIADELRRHGSEVTVAVGEHVRLPRTYRGRDIHWWMDAVGHLDERYDEVDDLVRARRLSSLQLIGSPERRTLDLAALMAIGVRVVGKLMGVAGASAQFSGAVTNLVANADLKQNRLLDRIDEFALLQPWTTALEAPSVASRPDRVALGTVPTQLPISRFATLIWATGYRPQFPFLDSSAFDRRHRIMHDGGVAVTPGLYFLGLPFLRRRKSNFIDGVGPDAAELMPHVRAQLSR